MAKAPKRAYHHGNVRAEMMEAALGAIVEVGAAGLSMRDLARRIGVTHGAAAHHFGDKTGLLTAVATEGFRLLGSRLREAWEETRSFALVGVAYVRFAAEHPAHFEVMFRPELYDGGDPVLVEEAAGASAVLYESASQVADAAGGDERRAGMAGWALVHGIATLWRDGNFGDEHADPVALAEQLIPLLFQSSAAARGARPRRRRSRAS